MIKRLHQNQAKTSIPPDLLFSRVFLFPADVYGDTNVEGAGLLPIEIPLKSDIPAGRVH